MSFVVVFRATTNVIRVRDGDADKNQSVRDDIYELMCTYTYLRTFLRNIRRPI